MLGSQSAVAVGNAGVIVDNLLFRKSIHWRYVSGIRAGNGLLILTSGGEKISSLMYGGSVVGAITGDRQARAVAIKIRRAQARAQAGSWNGEGSVDKYHSGLNFRPLPPVMILAVTKIVAGVSLALH